MSESVGPRSLHLRIVDQLRERIASGELPPGAQLPSNPAMMEEFGVSSHTAQLAIRVLKSEGIVEGVPGKGVYVRERRQLITRAAATLHSAGAGPQETIQVTDVREAAPAADVAEALGLAEGENAFVRRHLVVVDRVPVEIVSSYYARAMALGTPLAMAAPLLGGSLAELKRLGYVVDHVVDEVQARPPAPEEARLLRLRPGTSVFRVLRTVCAADGRPIEVVDSILGGDRYQLRYVVPIHG